MQLSGCITALATPFTAAGEIDLPAWRRLLQEQLDAGIRGVVVAGSTGEAAALFDAEYDALLRTAVEQVGGRIPVLAGTGQSNTAKTIKANRRAAALGADGALVVTPPYVRPTQAGLLAHYRAVADEGGLPVLLYNVPGRTGCDMAAETTATLSLHPNIVGIKEAVAAGERMQALLPLRRRDFAVLSGDDPPPRGRCWPARTASSRSPRTWSRTHSAACANSRSTGMPRARRNSTRACTSCTTSSASSRTRSRSRPYWR